MWLKRLCELAGVALGIFLVFIPRTAQSDSRQWTQFTHSFFLSYGKWGFTFALSLIILPSMLGIIRFMMDTKFFNWIAKVSFCTYLIHLTAMYLYFQNATTDFYLALIPQYGLFVSIAAISLGLGFLMTVTIELPLSRLQKILMQSLMKKK